MVLPVSEREPMVTDNLPCSSLLLFMISKLLYLLPAGFFLGLLFYPEDGSDMLLQNVS
jgi:hypothetical protein